MVEDQTSFDRLAETDFVGKQPADGICGRRAFRHVELVREQANTPAEERADSALANRPQPPDVMEDLVFRPGDRAIRTLNSRIRNLESRVDLRQRVTVCSDAERLPGACEVHDERAPL